jgi:uroporphyrinogen decarboxylase
VERFTLNFRERILITVNHEEPDRVPVMGLIMDPATSNQILGKENTDISAVLQEPESRAGLRDYMNSSWDEIYYGNFANALEAAIKLGFDANWTIYAYMQAIDDSEAKLGLAWHDVYGRVWELGDVEGAGLTFNYSRPLLTTEGKWEAWVEEKAPLFTKLVQDAAIFYKKLVDNYSDRIMPVGYAAPGIFENSWQPIGFVNFTRMVYEKPAFVKRVIDFQTDLYISCLESVLKSGGEVVIGGDDLGQKTGPMMHPEAIEKLYGDSYRRVAELVHKSNKKLIWHSCGNIYPLLDKFIEWGFDGIITMEPTAGMELKRVREQVGHRLVLVGNLDVSYLLVRGTRQEIEDAVKQAITDAAEGGGYILSASHSHPYVDGTRLEWMVEAAHRYGKYPLNSASTTI